MARCRVRDLDGVTRKIERWGSSRTAAQRALRILLVEGVWHRGGRGGVEASLPLQALSEINLQL
ncbi:MAG: hypothetical protein ACRDSP_26085 [Pseudonocardiaceae bacterium]